MKPEHVEFLRYCQEQWARYDAGRAAAETRKKKVGQACYVDTRPITEHVALKLGKSGSTIRRYGRELEKLGYVRIRQICYWRDTGGLTNAYQLTDKGRSALKEAA
jgi:D-mannonate dehydratase